MQYTNYSLDLTMVILLLKGTKTACIVKDSLKKKTSHWLNEQHVMDIMPCGTIMILTGPCYQDSAKGNTFFVHVVKTK